MCRLFASIDNGVRNGPRQERGRRWRLYQARATAPEDEGGSCKPRVLARRLALHPLVPPTRPRTEGSEIALRKPLVARTSAPRLPTLVCAVSREQDSYYCTLSAPPARYDPQYWQHLALGPPSSPCFPFTITRPKQSLPKLRLDPDTIRSYSAPSPAGPAPASSLPLATALDPLVFTRVAPPLRLCMLSATAVLPPNALPSKFGLPVACAQKNLLLDHLHEKHCLSLSYQNRTGTSADLSPDKRCFLGSVTKLHRANIVDVLQRNDGGGRCARAEGSERGASSSCRCP